MSLKLLLFVFLVSGYVILSAWGLDVQNKVDANNNRDNGILDKRDLKGDSTVAKYIDPQPEYYRGPPGSASSYGSERDRIRDRDGYVVGLQRPPYAGSSGTSYDSRYPPPRGTLAPSVGSNRYGGFQDKIGYNGSPSYGGSSYGGSGYSGNSYTGSGYSGSGYGSSYSPNQIPYGPIPIDFPNSYNGGPYPSAYGSNAGSFWSKKGFPGIDHFFPSADSGDYNYPGKSPFTKSLLVPLIGGAILGITAALVANPALLHLGMLSGKRRRRSTSATGESHHTDHIGKQDEHAQTLAYRAYKQKKLL